jgi:hypothetical protein
MPTNKKPVLSVLIDGEKRSQFAELCARNSRPMAWAVNAFITRCLEKDSIALDASGAIEIDTVLDSPLATTVDIEGLAELREMIAELSQNLKVVKVFPPHTPHTPHTDEAVVFHQQKANIELPHLPIPDDEDPESEKRRILMRANERLRARLLNKV